MSNILKVDYIKLSDGSFISGGKLYSSNANLAVDFNNFILTGGSWNIEGLSIPQTGQLTGQFYPLNSNPSSYITASQTGNFITTGQTGGFVANTGQLTGAFYPLNSNPAGYLTTGISYSQSGSYLFNTNITSGVTNQFISFPANLGNSPYVIAELNNPVYGNNIGIQVSGITGSGYWAQFSNITDNSNYIVTTLASISSNTGLATTVIVNTTLQTGTYTTWQNLTFNTGITLWNAQPNVVEDKQILIITGNVNLQISGLYNGWGGTLEIIQSGLFITGTGNNSLPSGYNGGTGYNITLPSGTQIINGITGSIFLTQYTSGAIDVFGFEYDNQRLLATIGFNF